MTLTSPSMPEIELAASAPTGDQAHVALVRSTLSSGFPWLLFPAALEQRFLTAQHEIRRQHFLISGLLALLVFNGFLYADYLMVPDAFELAVKLRVGIFTPTALLLLYLFWRSPFFTQSVAPLTVELVCMTAGLAAAVCLAFILSSTVSPYAHLYHVGVLVVIMYGNVVMRLRFWYAVVYSLALTAIHVAGVFMLPGFPERMIVPIMSLVTSTAAFTLTACYVLERDERRRYLMTERERGLIYELSDAQERLRESSRVDDLTTLYNRRHFQEQAQQMWQRAQFDRSAMAILMMDVDHFKKFNDRYGHPAGDACLKRVASVIRAAITRHSGLVARYGGEEFIAALPGLNSDQLNALAREIGQAVEDLNIEHAASPTASVVTASIGVVSCVATPKWTFEKLLNAADEALYHAKHEGRNRAIVQSW